jgi:hypothetical protein
VLVVSIKRIAAAPVCCHPLYPLPPGIRYRIAIRAAGRTRIDKKSRERPHDHRAYCRFTPSRAEDSRFVQISRYLWQPAMLNLSGGSSLRAGPHRKRA